MITQIKIKFNGREYLADKEENEYCYYYHLYKDGNKSWETVKVYKNPLREMYYLTTISCVEIINEKVEELE